MTKYDQLAEEAGWKVEERRGKVHFQPKDGREISIDKPESSKPASEVKTHEEEIDLKRLAIDPSYQRSLDPGWINYLKSNWNANGVGVLIVSQRVNGSMVVLDGQHRRAVMLTLGVAKARCEVYTGLTPALEAKLFNIFNTRKAVHPLQRHLARVKALDPLALNIERILRELGTKVAWHTKEGYPCISALETAYARGTLQDVIEILEASWPREIIRHGPMAVNAMSFFRQNYAGSNFKMDKAIKRFESVPLKGLLVAAKGDAIGMPQSQTQWLALGFKKLYMGRR